MVMPNTKHHQRRERRKRIRRLRAVTYVVQNGLCWWCGQKSVYCASLTAGRVRDDDATLDHLIPVSAGGTLERRNCVMACAKCNRRRGHRMVHPITGEVIDERGRVVVLVDGGES